MDGISPLDRIGGLRDFEGLGVRDADHLRRLLSCAIAFGYFSEVHIGGEAVRYCNNRLSACLREGHVQSQKDFVRPVSRVLFAILFRSTVQAWWNGILGICAVITACCAFAHGRSDV